MTVTLTMDRAGRVVLPKPVRDRLQLEPGELLELESLEDHIVLKPVRTAAAMRKKQGIWVIDTGEPLSASVIEETVQSIREERMDKALGKRR